ncbi:MAG: hypothetical protein J6L88_06555 [Clostridia bacterium]|nr:hypothetical protein [Clostridia bacterium]
MKKVFLLLMLAVLIFLFFSCREAALACRDGVDLFLTRVLPTLLPFLIVSGTLSRLGAANTLAHIVSKPFHALFRLPGESAYAFACGMFCGNPIGAQSVSGLSSLSPSQTTRTAALCAFVSPAFLMGTVASSMLGDPSSAIPIMAGHYLGAVVTGYLFSLNAGKKEPLTPPAISTPTTCTPFSALTAAVSDAAQALPKICVFIAFFSVLLAAMHAYHVFDLAAHMANFLHLDPKLLQAMLTAFLEVTAGCRALASLSCPVPLKYACVSFALSFGGLCVLMQNFSFLPQIRKRYYLSFRMVHAGFSFLITYVFSLLQYR